MRQRIKEGFLEEEAVELNFERWMRMDMPLTLTSNNWVRSPRSECLGEVGKNGARGGSDRAPRILERPIMFASFLTGHFQGTGRISWQLIIAIYMTSSKTKLPKHALKSPELFQVSLKKEKKKRLLITFFFFFFCKDFLRAWEPKWVSLHLCLLAKVCSVLKFSFSFSF